ncbi:MAG: coenzyme F420-0:L-glutamate ligase [Thermoleophilia bacterium]
MTEEERDTASEEAAPAAPAWQFGGPNPGKQLTIDTPAGRFARYPLYSHLVTGDDDIAAVVREHAQPYLEPGDILAISEKIVAICEGRSYPLAEIHPTRLANIMCKFVTRTPHGIGIGSPWTMEFALREAGAPRIFAAACASAVTKPFGVKGVFYRVAGPKVAAIDGPTDGTIPPYNRCVTLGPSNPRKSAAEISAALGGRAVAIIDANDLGVKVLGASGVDPELVAQAFKDNPLGQGEEQTPMAVLRRVEG